MSLDAAEKHCDDGAHQTLTARRPALKESQRGVQSHLIRATA